MSDEKFTIVRHSGRLIEARVFALWTTQDADEYGQKMQLVARALPPNTRPVLLADHRPVKVYPAAVADRLVELFTNMNLSLERAALVVTRNNVPLTLQLQRLVDAAENSMRRLFPEPRTAVTHLQPILTEAELARAAAFLDEHVG